MKVKNLSKKTLAIVISIVALLLVGAITVLAAVYIFDKEDPKTSTFVPSTVACSVTESSGSYSVSTSGSNIPTYVRVAVVAYFGDNSGNVYWQAPSISVGANSNWQKVGDFYYYKGSVAANSNVAFGNVTSSTPVPDGYSLKVKVLAENIQAEPAGAAQDAWGLVYNGSSWVTP